MSNIKDLFELYKNQKVLASKSLNDLAPEGEGADWVNSTIKLKNQVDLQIDFSEPANFSRYGSAQQYYTDAFSYIGNEFPYDGSKKEQIEWLYGGSSFDKYIYDNEYPRTTGYINLGVNYGGVGPGGISGYEAPTVDEYISFKGGPHPSNVPNASLSQYFDSHQGAVPDANYYDEDTNQQSNLELNADDGNTAEFWFKKNGWTGDPVESDKQIFVDIWNSASLGGTYGRLRVECDFSITPHQFSVAFQSGTTGGFLDSNLGQLGQNIDLTGSTWNHYAFTFVNNGANLEAKLYLNGELNDSISTGSIGEITGSMLGWIGAMGTTIDTPVTGGLGFAKLSGSMDEFRFWKTKRSSEQIGQYWFTQVGGGTNTDVSENWYAPTKYSYSNPVDLGVYYKFNEGIINTASVENTDAIILDYSGRITNGAWTGYSIGSRDTGSAMVESSASLAEFKDPILYSYNPLVSAALENLLLQGFNYDINNNASIYNSLPGWIRDDDAVNDRHTLLKLIQVMGSYFDILQLQTERLPRLKDVDYISSIFKPLPFADRLLESSGLSVGELFADAAELESLANRDDVLNFAEKLDDTKNRIYKNIYNNLVYIFKSKGSEKSIRNLIRCYGVGEELIKLNLYGDEVTYDIKENYVSTITRKEYANFNVTSSWEATVFQTSSTSDASSLSYISSSAEQIYRGQTFQLESIFPKQVSPDNIAWWSTTFLTSSLGGCHTPSATETDLTWQSPDVSNFQIYAIRPSENDKDARFMLSSSTGGVFPTLTSSLQKDVYENSKWNIAVKVKPTNYQWPNVVLGSTPTTYDVEFIGYNNILDSTDNSFLVTGTMSYADGQSFLSSSKRIYIGAHRTNFTGSVLQRSDTKISSVRYWMDYLEDSTILAHAKDPSNFGRKHPGKNTFLNQPGNLFSEEVTKVPEIETLALQWDFSQVTGSDALGEFFVGDFSSGSTSAAAPYGDYGDLVKIKHPGKGFSFPASNADATIREFVYTAKQDSPEVINSSDMVQIRNDEDIEIFTRDTRPIRFFFTIEKSMNAIISAEMIKLFATVIDFNNLIGEPVNRYRQDYKSLEKMRQLFFERVQNSTMDFEKFVDYFKWIDESMGKMVTQLFPASANFSPKVFSMIESHVLERNKYWNKFPTLEMDAKDPEAGLYGINEMMYPYKRGKAPIPLNQTSSCVWAHERAEAETFSSGDPIIDSQRNTFREANDWRPNSTPPTLTDIAGVTPVQYEGSTYALKNFTKPYRFKAKIMPELKGGTNVSKIKNLQYAHTELPFGTSTQLTISSSQIEDDIDCDDIVNPNDKVKLRYKLTNNPISYASGDGDIFAPFDLYSSSVTTGYASAIPPMGATPKQIDLRNYHNDVYGDDYEIPAQGPFTEKYVGGWEHRHVPFPNTNCSPSTGSLATGSLAARCRPEAWNLGFDGSDLEITSRTTHQARSTILREPLAKRPVNIRNIKQTTGSTIIGNYSQEYEVVQTSGRKINNRFFVKNGGFVPIYAASPWIDGLIDYGLPDFSKYGATKNIFVERFNAPGGPDVSSRGVLDLYAEEYAIRNELNQRNMVVRAPLNEWSMEHCGPFGIDPTGSPGDGTTPEQHAVRACCYTGTIGAYFKVNRNSKTLGALVGTSSTELTTSIQYDNWFVQHQIPRSELQYSWINASYDNTKAQPFGLLGSGDGGRSNFTVPSGTLSTNAPMVQFTPSGSAYAFRSNTLTWNGSAWVPHYPSCGAFSGFFNSSSLSIPEGSGLGLQNSVYTDSSKLSPTPFGDDGYGVTCQTGLSISFWMKVTGSHDDDRVVISRWVSQAGVDYIKYCDWRVYVGGDTPPTANTDKVVFEVVDHKAGPAQIRQCVQDPTIDVTDGDWHNVVVVLHSFDGDPADDCTWIQSVYIDGDNKLVTTTTTDNLRIDPTDTIPKFILAGQYDDTAAYENWFAYGSGSLDEVSIWQGIQALSSGQIEIIHNGTKGDPDGCPTDLSTDDVGTPPTLTSWWRMGDTFGDDPSSIGAIQDVQLNYNISPYTKYDSTFEFDVPSPCPYPGTSYLFTASLDFVGLNTYINDPIVESQNLLSSSDSDYENRAFAYLCPRINPARDMLHALLLHRDGPYQYPSWKQIRTGETSIARYQKNNNIITVGSKDKILLTPLEKGNLFYDDSSFAFGSEWYKDSGSTAYYTEPPVTFKYNPLTTGLINQNPSLADGVARNSIPPVMIRNTFSNNLSFCANYGLTEDLGLGDYNTQTRRFGRTPETQMHDLLRQQYQRNTNKFKFLKYSEWNYPRQIYTGLAENRGRTNYAETASVDFNGFAIASYGSNGIDRNSTYRRTFWKDDWLTRNRKLETLQEFGDNLNLLTGNFDFRTTLSSSLGYTDGWASSIWPMGTNKTFHNTASSDTLILATTYTSKTGGDFGELTRLNYDNLISVFNGEIIPSSSLYLSGNDNVGNATCPITASNSLTNFTDTSCGAQTINYTWYGGGAPAFCCGWNHALWDTSSAQTYLGSASCPGGTGSEGCYGCDFTTGIYTLYTIGNIGHYTFQPSGTIESSESARLWCMRMGLQPSGSTYLASTSSVCLSSNCDTVCTSVVTGSNDYTMTFSIMVGAPDQAENAYNVGIWSYSAWVSSSVASIKTSHNGNNVCRFTSSAGVGVLKPQTDRYRIMRNWNDQITSSVTENPYTSVQVNLQREILFQRNTGSCWETFHREDVNTLHYNDTSVDGGPILDLTQSCVALNQSYYAVVDFSGTAATRTAYYKSASMTNFETNYEQSCPESSYWTASISYTYPAGFITNDKGYYTSSIGIYKDYGLMWNVTNERKRMVDAGLVSNAAGTPSLRKPSYNSYDEYAQDIRVMGKDYSIMPEFRMSSMMSKDNPYATHTDFLELPGGKITSSVSADGALNLDFIREYSNSDFLKEFDLLMDQQEDSRGWMSVGSLSLTCKGIKKLLPYDGFYPMSRTTQLSTLFADALDYSSSVGGRNLQLYKWDKTANCFVATTETDYTSSATLNSIRKQGITTPFFAPGIVYNSIKSGVGVGWTVVTGTCLSDTYTLQNVNTSSVSGNLSGGDFLNTVVYKDPSIARKIDFETIYDINKLFHKDPGKPSGTVDAAFHIDYPEALDGGFGLDLDCGLTGCSAQGENIDSPNQHFMLSWNGRNPENKISKYNQAMNNFLSECVRFFLRDPKNPETFNQGQLNYFESLPVVACNFVSGATYYMDVILEKTEAKPFTMCESGFSGDFSYTPSQFTAKDPVCRLPDFDEPCEYATWSLGPEKTPPVDRSIYNTYSTFDGRYFGPATQKWKSIFNWSSASEGAHYNVSDPAQAPYTPPYYYGKSIARIKYTPGDEWTSQAFQNTNPLDIFFEKMEIEFVNTELEEKIKLGNMNYIASTTSPSASVFEDTFSTSSFAYQMAQNVGDSINLKGIKNELEIQYDGVGKLISATNTYSPGKSRWIISSKFECPILDFSNQEAQTLTVSGGLHPPTSLSSSGFLDQQPVRLGKGMWSGYGVRKGDSNFVTMGISKVDPAIISPTQIVDGVEISTSLINAFGFNNVPGQTSLHKEVGVLANKRKISEAVVAIPFTGQANIPETPGWNRAMASTANPAQMSSVYNMLNEGRNGEVNLFAIDRKRFDPYREAPPNAELPKNSITDMVKMMNEFVLPPSMDFVQNPGIDPFVMYIFKFEQELDQVDLQDIWQGVLPSIGVKAEIEDVTIKHSLLDSNEFFHKRRLPTDVRWLVFKIKKRATMEYSQVTQWNTDDVGGLITPQPQPEFKFTGQTLFAPPIPRIETKFSYNWPHDFYSLVELGKINTEVEFNKKLLPASTEVDSTGRSEGTGASNADQDQSRSEGTGAQSGGTGASSQDPGSDPGDNSLGGG